jgi:hypothetical protein
VCAAWLNQCVGHYNHRYFFCTMAFMWLGCVIITIGMWPGLYEHYWQRQHHNAQLDGAMVVKW